MKKRYTLNITYQYTSFEIEYEKTKAKEFGSDDLTELVNILTKYLNGFISKEKKSHCWMHFSAVIRDNALVSFVPEYTLYKITMERRD